MSVLPLVAPCHKFWRMGNRELPPDHRPEFSASGPKGAVMDAVAWAGREFEKAAIHIKQAGDGENTLGVGE